MIGTVKQFRETEEKKKKLSKKTRPAPKDLRMDSQSKEHELTCYCPQKRDIQRMQMWRTRQLGAQRICFAVEPTGGGSCPEWLGADLINGESL